MKQSKQMKFMNNMLLGWSFEDNYGFPEQGKIWVIWHQSARIRVISKSLQMVSCEVLLPDWQHCCVVSIVYASYDEELRKELWKSWLRYLLVKMLLIKRGLLLEILIRRQILTSTPAPKR